MGIHALTWNLRDDGGRAVAKGLYFAQLRAKGATRSVRLVVLE